jgi:hypothetical protein
MSVLLPLNPSFLRVIHSLRPGPEETISSLHSVFYLCNFSGVNQVNDVFLKKKYFSCELLKPGAGCGEN